MSVRYATHSLLTYSQHIITTSRIIWPTGVLVYVKDDIEHDVHKTENIANYQWLVAVNIQEGCGTVLVIAVHLPPNREGIGAQGHFS